jgi:hypothetical protein
VGQGWGWVRFWGNLEPRHQDTHELRESSVVVEEDSRMTWLRSRWRGGKPHSTGRELFDLITLHSDSLWVIIQIREAEPLYKSMCSEPPLSRNFVIQVRKRLLYSRVSCCDVRARWLHAIQHGSVVLLCKKDIMRSCGKRL